MGDKKFKQNFETIIPFLAWQSTYLQLSKNKLKQTMLVLKYFAAKMSHPLHEALRG